MGLWHNNLKKGESFLNDCEGKQLIRWTIVERASHQNHDGTKDSNIRVRTTSRRCRFFLSTTSVCWGVLDEEKLWKISFLLQNDLNSAFLNSVPWLLMIEKMKSLFFHFEPSNRISNTIKDSCLCARK